MSRRVLSGVVVAVALALCFGLIARADVEPAFKDEFKGLLKDLRGCLKNFQATVQTRLRTPIHAALSHLESAQQKIDNGVDDNEVLALKAAWAPAAPQTPSLAQVDLRAIEGAWGACADKLDQLAAMITQGEADQRLDDTEANALRAILDALRQDSSYHINVTGIEIYLELAKENIEIAIEADINTDGGPWGTPDNDIGDTDETDDNADDEDTWEAQSSVEAAVNALREALKTEKEFLDNLKIVRRQMNEMRRIIAGARKKASAPSTALSVARTGIIFKPQASGVRGFQVRVYSLTGKLVFDSGMVYGPALRWNYLSNDGQPLANGVYLYTVTVQGADGIYRSELKKLAVLR